MSIDVDGCTLLKYEIDRENEEHEFSVVPEINKNIILGRDWLKQFSVSMYYDIRLHKNWQILCQNGRRYAHLLIS